MLSLLIILRSKLYCSCPWPAYHMLRRTLFGRYLTSPLFWASGLCFVHACPACTISYPPCRCWQCSLFSLQALHCSRARTQSCCSFSMVSPSRPWRRDALLSRDCVLAWRFLSFSWFCPLWLCCWSDVNGKQLRGSLALLWCCSWSQRQWSDGTV